MAGGRPDQETCFVVMPFGWKPVDDYEYDFNLVWKCLIEPAVRRAGYTRVERADSTNRGSLITSAMVTSLMTADLVIADITGRNPNVFWELGARHALRGQDTVVIERKGGELGRRELRDRVPDEMRRDAFDIYDVTRHFYQFDEAELEEEIGRLQARIEDVRAVNEIDSPVFANIPGLTVEARPVKADSGQRAAYRIRDVDGCFIGYRGGELDDLTGPDAVDIWVNSENNLMQMARMHEKAVSATIRYLGAYDVGGPTFQDTIAEALRVEMGGRTFIEAGEVLQTTAGKLGTDAHQVKAILHAVTAIGTPGGGWSPVPLDKIEKAVKSVVRMADEHLRTEPSLTPLPSVVMPIFGTGQARGTLEPKVVVSFMASNAIDSMRRLPSAGRRLRAVWLSAYSQQNVNTVKRALEELARQGEIEPVAWSEVVRPA